METLSLSKIDGFEVWASNEDKGTNATVRGRFKDHSLAVQASKGIGFFGRNGDVEPAIFYTDGDLLYTVECVGKFTDEEKSYRERIIESIKSKLTEEEKMLLDLK